MDTFKAILEHSPQISNLRNHKEYFAHRHLIKNSESLEEHVILVNQYGSKLVESHGLDAVINSLITDLLGNCENVGLCADMLKMCFVGTIVCHDFGKVNENFQAFQMRNVKNFSEKKTILKPTHGHSKLGVFLYLTHYITQIYKCEIHLQEKVLLASIVYHFAYSIMRHHSSKLQAASEKNGFTVEFVDTFIHFKPYLLLHKIENDDALISTFLNKISDWWSGPTIKQNPFNKISTNKFPLFALIKLNFSILTAADYLATHHYSSSSQNGNEGETADFGIFTSRERIRKIAAHLQGFEHNKRAFANVDNYQFYHPTERSNTNLNILREEMAVEVIQTIRRRTTERLFYLEAPTGGGKTNLSAIVATELLLANSDLNKIYYVFPFTTLITQTFKSLKESLGLKTDEIAELHSKAGFVSKKETKSMEEEEDGVFGKDKKDYIDRLFALYPITLLSHVRFFDILKTNRKETNYLLHRLANSVVIIDELQSYNPAIWDKMLYFISDYAQHFNIRFVLMSATLPKISELKTGIQNVPQFVDLLPNARKYITNPNFSERVKFNFELFEQGKIDIKDLTEAVTRKSEEYSLVSGDGGVKTIVEFIFKKSAAKFLNEIKDYSGFDEVYLLSGTVLEGRRKQIISAIKEATTSTKILLITTQVVEAGVDIDMDLGFKNASLIDSDEQLAGRVNRNASKPNCEVYLFKMDDAGIIYGGDYRYQKTREEIDMETYKTILSTKDFKVLYDKVLGHLDKNNKPLFADGIDAYTDNLSALDFPMVDKEFVIIDADTTSVFVPLTLAIKQNINKPEDDNFSEPELSFLARFKCYPDEEESISGEAVWEIFEGLIEQKTSKKKNEGGFDLQEKINFKSLQTIMAKFTFSLLLISNTYIELKKFGVEKYGYLYLHGWNTNDFGPQPYTLEAGLNEEAFKTSNFI